VNAMRCTKIHDSIYYDAFLIATYSSDTAHNDDDPLLANAYATCWEREQFHNVHTSQFCTDCVCDGWDKANRWSERAQRGW
jgi:hypothetical protein